ncbi:hypothetical protein [Nonomuraea sp. NPDC049309]|uniref:hypothetical protein n=1 Tax=Nonomuraea sp. NPDC049309 TaxID=3364350 RepID=UPI003714B108
MLADTEEPARRLVPGNTLGEIEAIYAERLREWREWAPVTEAAFRRGTYADVAGSSCA